MYCMVYRVIIDVNSPVVEFAGTRTTWAALVTKKRCLRAARFIASGSAISYDYLGIPFRRRSVEQPISRERA
jgi:hypothetical protein